MVDDYTSGSEPIAPTVNPHTGRHPGTLGLTKREYFAAAMMQALIQAYPAQHQRPVADQAVAYADALIEALDKRRDEGGKRE